jgi:hypothetical protein
MAKAQVEDLGLWGGSPDGIRTRATALRGRRARPLHNGARGLLLGPCEPGNEEELYRFSPVGSNRSLGY